MDLRRYLFENRLTRKEFAERIDYTSNYVVMICKGKKPGPKAAKAIEKATNGIVKYNKNEEVLEA